MYNTGTIITLSAPAGGTNVYSYVWDFWDGTSQATITPMVTKLVNIGGNPITGDLNYSCTAVDIYGGTAVTSSTIMANNPPQILPGVQVISNNGYFPYSGSVIVSAIDFENDPITFSWYGAGTLLGSGITTSVGTEAGTWSGNGTSVVLSLNAYQNNFSLTVQEQQAITCYVVDNLGGTVSLDFIMQGSPMPPLDTSINAAVQGLAFDASSSASAVIGPGQTVSFSVFATPINNTLVSFDWSFYGSNGWTVPGSSSGNTVVFPNGAVQNTVVVDISNEIVSTGSSKEVTANVIITATTLQSGTGITSYANLSTNAELIQNPSPTSIIVYRYANSGTTAITGNGPVPAGTLLTFAAVSGDSNDDLMTYTWQFNPEAVDTLTYAYGPQVVYDTTGLLSGTSINGQVNVTNRYGGSLGATFPAVLIS